MRADRGGRRVAPVPVALLLAAIALGGCRGTEIEDLIGKVEWFSNMRDQASILPFEESPRHLPEGTRTVDAGIPLMETPEDYAGIVNPVPVSDASLARGRELYDIFCAVCHGPQGRGGGRVEGPFPAGLIPQLGTQRARDFSDGYLFGIMSTGRGLMPTYRRVPQADRWHIVNYVRQLQSLPAGGAGDGQD